MDVKIQTEPFDARFPNVNQTKRCWQNYYDYSKCVAAKGEEFAPCRRFMKAYMTLCPNEWIEKWDVQKDEAVAKMRFHFETATTSKAGPRKGMIMINRGVQGKLQVDTPSFLKYTRHGMQPHLVPEVATGINTLPPITRIQIEDFLDERDLEKRSFKSLREFARLGEDMVVLDTLDPTIIARTARSAEKHMGIDSEGGVRRLVPTAFAQAVNQLDPDVVVAPADFVHDAQPSLTQGKRISKSVARSIRWLDDMLAGVAHAAVLAPVMGSLSPELRAASVQALSTRSNIAGYVFSDVALAPSDRLWALQQSLPQLDATKLRCMAGASAPDMALRAVLNGVDLVDSSYAYAVTEQGWASAYTLKGADMPAHVDLWAKSMADDFGPLVAGCTCTTCSTHSRAYVHHLLNAHEMLATVLLQAHNLYWYQHFFVQIRQSLSCGSLAEDAAAFFEHYGPSAFEELDRVAEQTCSPTTKVQHQRHA
ncbi:hypothetical protein IWW36_002739 [Coemansia brasiliensis]|uniref:Queuine tRNA-ribosyltransferase accessory subunit 2 n=1 Tax=Coemansia brasiliensis TaxID=2650707 RepID=A0A9W8I7H3_9FUNG|nr:hypothetical protein IWW36_002739 [Coemansia brasiliensis]